MVLGGLGDLGVVPGDFTGWFALGVHAIGLLLLELVEVIGSDLFESDHSEGENGGFGEGLALADDASEGIHDGPGPGSFGSDEYRTELVWNHGFSPSVV